MLSAILSNALDNVLRPRQCSQKCSQPHSQQYSEIELLQAVFEAEKITEAGRSYHRRCFVCCQCKRPQDDKLQVCVQFTVQSSVLLPSNSLCCQVFVGFDSKIYCSVCYPKQKPLPPEVNTKKLMAPEGLGCPKCGGRVFESEKMTVSAGTFHKICFTCQSCNQPLNYSKFVSEGKQVFCQGCFTQFKKKTIFNLFWGSRVLTNRLLAKNHY